MPICKRVVADLGKLLIGGDGQEHVGRLHADLEVVEIVLLQDVGVVQRALDQGFGVGFAVFLQQMPLQRAGIDADAHRAAVVAGGLDDLLHPLVAADVAGVDAQAGGAAVGGFQGAPVVEMDIGDDRHADLADDVLQRQRAFLVGAGDPDDIHAGGFGAPDLRHGAGDVGGQRVGHGLHRDRCAVAHRDRADIDPARLAPDDLLVGAIAHAGLLCRRARPATAGFADLRGA